MTTHSSNQPPRLDEIASEAERPWMQAAGWLVVLVAATLFCRLLVETKATFTKCIWKEQTELACPFCGSTRALASLSRGELIEACSYNPVVTGSTTIAIAVCAVGVVRPRAFHAARCFLKRRLRRKEGQRAVLIFCALNWAYLLYASV